MAHSPASPEFPYDGLPIPLTPLVGRESLVAEIQRWLGKVRLLTLTGPGGVGKTRVALQVAEEMRTRFKEGVLFLPLATLTNPDHVALALASRIGLKEQGTSLVESLTAYFQSKEVLLLLDNFEHLLAAAPLVGQLLEMCTGVKVLTTSREPLHLYGEQELPIPPLTLPDASNIEYLQQNVLTQMEASPALDLLVQRIRAVQPHFQLSPDNVTAVAELCRRLDGLPLALELAAAQLKFFTPQSLLAGLDQRLQWLATPHRNLPPRQQTMRNAIAWSYELLSTEEQRLLARLALFGGHFTAEAASAICQQAGDPPFTIEATIARLVDKSLLQQNLISETPRYAFLETIRAFALEQLETQSDKTGLQQAFVTYFVTLAEEAEPHLWGAAQTEWLGRLREEEAQWRMALGWAFGDHSNEALTLLGVRLAMALRRFWEIEGRFHEARLWLEQVLLRRALLPLTTQNRLLNLVGSLVQLQGDFVGARHYHHEALRLAEQLDDVGMRATTLQCLGMLAGRQGDYHEAERMLSHVVNLERQRNTIVQLSVALNNLALAVRELGDYPRAAALWEESLALKRARGDGIAIAATLANLGTLALVQGDIEKARALQRESLQLRHQAGDQPGLAISLCNLAGVAVAEKAWMHATRLYAAADQIFQRLQSRLSADVTDSFTRNVAQLRTTLGEEAFAAGWHQGATWSVKETVAYALNPPSSKGVPPVSVSLPPFTPPPKPTDPDALTPREVEVLQCVAEGLTDAEVAARLVVSPRTVSTHLHRIYSKLGVSTRTGAVRAGQERGLL
jgi:predicted ATPase/DNA-binding CsgD family transcriptional regulator